MSSYADTSFLVSLYVFDAHSTLVAKLMERAELPILLTPLCELELANALYLRLFRRELVPSKAKTSHGLFSQDIEGGIYQLKPLSPAIFERAKLMAHGQTPRLGTRTLDVLHVASALILQADTFYTCDHNQAKLAKAEGLKVP